MKKRTSPLISFRVWLVLVSASASIPMIIFSFISLLSLISSQRELESLLLSRRVTAIAGTLERHLEVRASLLKAIAQSEAGRTGDLQAVYNHAARLVPVSPGLIDIALVDANGAILFNTLRPFGEKLPDTADPDSAKHVIETGRPLASGVFQGAISNEPVTSLGVAMPVHGQPRYCLRAVAPAAELNALLATQQLPEDWIIFIMDGSGNIVAQSHAPEVSVGSKIGAPLAEVIRQNLSIFLARGGSHNGAIETALAKVGDWEWTVVVSVSEHAFSAALRQLLIKFGMVGGGCLLLGGLVSYWLSRRLACDLDAVTTASAALAEGVEPPQGRTIIRELENVQACLLVAKDREVSAKIDLLTNLPGRALFLELASEKELECQKADDLGLAIMFMDLDGFKQVNDQFGHTRGDWILGQTAAVIRANIRDQDVAGRLGGDEFAICLTVPKGVLRPAVISIAERLVAQVRLLGYNIGCSVGISICENCTPDLKRALQLADEAMYEAKRLGKNQFILHEDTTRQ